MICFLGRQNKWPGISVIMETFIYMEKEFRLERSLKEKICTWLFGVIYRFYRPKLGCKRIRVNKPFKYYVNGRLSSGTYVYSQGRTGSITNIGLFHVTAKGGWTRASRDDFFFMAGVHCDIEYLDELKVKIK